MRSCVRSPLFASLVALGSCLWGCAASQKQGSTAAHPKRGQSFCETSGRHVEEVDLNGDGVADVWKMYGREQGAQVDALMCKEVDFNLDGRKDMWTHYDAGGNKVKEQFDLDFDGKVDLWVTYQNGRKVREEMDTNFDGEVDLFKYYEGERLSRIERSSKHNGKIDVWEYYEGGKLDRIGYDTTGQGQPDKWDRSPDDAVPAEPPMTAQAPPPQADKPPLLPAPEAKEPLPSEGDKGADKKRRAPKPAP